MSYHLIVRTFMFARLLKKRLRCSSKLVNFKVAKLEVCLFDLIASNFPRESIRARNDGVDVMSNKDFV